MTSYVLGLVINPTSGLGRGAKIGDQVRQLFVDAGVAIVELSADNAKDAFARARAAAMDGLDGLVVVGGDGMVNLGVNATIGTTTPLAIIAAGSGNDFAQTLGLPLKDVRAGVAAVLEALEHASVVALDAAQVEPYVTPPASARFGRIDAGATSAHSDTSRRWYAGSLSIGIDAAVNAQANTYSWPRGHLKYLRAVVACLAGFKPFGHRITVDGKTFESAGTLAAVSNAPNFGGGIQIAPMADLTDGLLDLVFATPLTQGQIMKIFPKLYKGHHVSHPAVSFQQGSEFIIEPGPQGQFPPVAFADGEVVGTVPLRVKAHRGALKVLLVQPEAHATKHNH